jgi:formamidopyrimidine-DNA glycosylase
MPELPEVETIKKQLQKSIKGKKIRSSTVFTDKMVFIGSGQISNIKKGSKQESAQFIQKLENKRVLDVERRAKYLIVRLSNDFAAIIHLRMSGQLIYIPKADLKKPLRLSMAKTAQLQTLPAKHTHVAIEFTDGSVLFYNDTRQFGHLRIVEGDEFEKVLGSHHLGPEPLSLSLKEFEKVVSEHPEKRAKDFLLNQQIIAGIGNIYADESLFISKIRPQRKMKTLEKSEVRALHQAIVVVLKDAIKAGGSSLEYFLMTNGDSGKFVSEHQVYGRAGESCVECGEKLLTTKIASRTTVYCARCQR